MTELNLGQAAANAGSEATLRDILAPLFRRRRLVLLSFCGILLGAVVAALYLSS